MPQRAITTEVVDAQLAGIIDAIARLRAELHDHRSRTDQAILGVSGLETQFAIILNDIAKLSAILRDGDAGGRPIMSRVAIIEVEIAELKRTVLLSSEAQQQELLQKIADMAAENRERRSVWNNGAVQIIVAIVTGVGAIIVGLVSNFIARQ